MISDVLYNVLKLLYDQMPVGNERKSEQPYAAKFVANFRGKLMEVVDNENLMYAWSLAAMVDGWWSSLHFLWRIWNSDHEFPVVRAKYKMLSSWKGMICDHLTKLVS